MYIVKHNITQLGNLYGLFTLCEHWQNKHVRTGEQHTHKQKKDKICKFKLAFLVHVILVANASLEEVNMYNGWLLVQ